MEMNFVTLTENEYKQFYDEYECPCFWQSPSMSHYKEKKGWVTHYVGVKDDHNQLIAASTLVSIPVFLKYSLFMALRGFLIDYDNLELVDFFLCQLKKYLHENHCLYFKTDPYVVYQNHEKDGSICEESNKKDDLLQLFAKHGMRHLGFRDGDDNNFEPRWMSVLDLKGKTEAQILKEMDAQTRQNVKNTLKTGIKVVELEPSEYSILHEIVSATGERRNFLNPDLNYYLEFKEVFQDRMKVLYAYLDTEDYCHRFQEELRKLEEELVHIDSLIAESDTPKNAKKRQNCIQRMEAANKRVGEAIALKDEYGDKISLGAAMFISTPYEVVYLFSGSYNQFNRFKGAYAIQWKMIQYGIERNINRYNFYGISGIFNDTAEDYGVYLFKKGFNADVEELVGDFEYIDRKGIYKLYNTLRTIKGKLLSKE